MRVFKDRAKLYVQFLDQKKKTKFKYQCRNELIYIRNFEAGFASSF